MTGFEGYLVSGILIKEGDQKTDGSNIVNSALRRVIRENWQSGANADQKLNQILSEHATRMESLLGSFDYGAICMPNIISNSKRMTYKELVAYLTLLESLGVGYKQWFNNEFANIFLAGLTLKARDTHAIAKHLDSFMSGMEKRIAYYESKSSRENKGIEELIMEFEKKNGGFLRFFRKGELAALRKMINMRTGNLKTLSKRRERYSNIVVKVKGSRKR